jgi:hypothetical protein
LIGEVVDGVAPAAPAHADGDHGNREGSGEDGLVGGVVSNEQPSLKSAAVQQDGERVPLVGSVGGDHVHHFLAPHDSRAGKRANCTFDPSTGGSAGRRSPIVDREGYALVLDLDAGQASD